MTHGQDSLNGITGEGMAGILEADKGRRTIMEAPGNGLHNYRTAQQRSLGTPVTLATALNTAFVSGEAINLGLYHSSRGILPGADPIDILADNEDLDRPRISGLVLYAMRVTTTCLVAGDLSTEAPQQQMGCQLKKLARDQLEITIYDSTDTDNPMMAGTPIGYFERPDGAFMPVPPTKWINRAPKIQISSNNAAYLVPGFNEAQSPTDVRLNAPVAPAPFPEGVVFQCDVNLSLNVQIETLWMPDPGKCGSAWPGFFIPLDKIANLDNLEKVKAKCACTEPVGVIQMLKNAFMPRVIREAEAYRAIQSGNLQRTVSQRSLSAPTIWQSIQEAAIGDDLFDACILSAGTGVVPTLGTGIFGAAKPLELVTGQTISPPKQFNRANADIERRRVSNLALVAMRAHFSVVAGFPSILSPPLPNWQPYMLSQELERIFCQWVGLQVLHTSDEQEPWISPTTISYFNRPNGDFVPVPGLLYTGRDPKMVLVAAPGQLFNAGVHQTVEANKRPNLFPMLQPLNLDVTLTIECLWELVNEGEGGSWIGSNLCGPLKEI